MEPINAKQETGKSLENDQQDAKSAEFWDDVAKNDQWGGFYGILEADRRLSAYRDQAEKRLLFPRLQRFQKRWEFALEIGSGGGRWTVELAKHYSKVLATDIAPTMITRLDEALEREGIRNVTTRVESLTRFVATPEPADLIYLGSCLQYIDDEGIKEGMARLESAVGPDSLLLSRDTVSTIGRTFHRHERYKTGDPTIYRRAEDYQELLGAYGWKLAADWPSYIRPLSWRLRKLYPDAWMKGLMQSELPLAEFELKLSRLLDPPKDKQHRFFLYVRA